MAGDPDPFRANLRVLACGQHQPPAMLAPPSELFLRPTIIAGDRLADDWQVIWDGIPISCSARRAARPAELVVGRDPAESAAAALAPRARMHVRRRQRRMPGPEWQAATSAACVPRNRAGNPACAVVCPAYLVAATPSAGLE